MNEKIFVSAEGLERLKAQLETMKAELASIRKEKAVAYTATGDTWHDNPYFNKLEQDEQRKALDVGQMEAMISRAEVFQVETRNTKRVQLGSIVAIYRYFELTGEEQEEVWEIGGHGETDSKKRLVAYNSPLGSALIGLKVGETNKSTGPKGPVEYELRQLFANWDEVPK